MIQKSNLLCADKGKMVFVVDDEPLLVDLAEAILSAAGFNITTFHDPRIALETISTSESKPALLITDCVMGSIDGLELIERSRQIAPKIKTILLSGTVDDQFLAAHPVKPDRFLRKPYQARALLERVRELLNSAG